MKPAHEIPPIDRRAQRTRRALREALASALACGDWSDVSVASLARDADVSRPTFYLHFQSVEDLAAHSVQHVLAPAIAAIADDMLRMPISEHGLAEYAVGVWDEHAESIRTLVAGAPQHVFVTYLADQVAGLFGRFTAINGLPALPEREAEYISGFVGAATFGMVWTWLSRGQIERPRELARLFGLLIGPGIDRALAGGR